VCVMMRRLIGSHQNDSHKITALLKSRPSSLSSSIASSSSRTIAIVLLLQTSFLRVRPEPWQL